MQKVKNFGGSATKLTYKWSWIFCWNGVVATQIRKVLHDGCLCWHHIQRTWNTLPGRQAGCEQFFELLKSRLQIMFYIHFTDKSQITCPVLKAQGRVSPWRARSKKVKIQNVLSTVWMNVNVQRKFSANVWNAKQRTWCWAHFIKGR